MAQQVALYSDGGGERGSTAAGACVIDGPAGRLQLVLFLGGATNNEAEISAGLLAFSALRVLGKSDPPSVRWVCDSEYVLKSATEYIHNWQKNGWKTAAKKPVKNQGLWRAYLKLRGGIKVEPEHVRGHTGHPENEACDTASTWARNYAYSVLAREEEGMLITSTGAGDDIGWFLLDGRQFLSALRSVEGGEPEDAAVFALVEKLRELNIAAASSKKRSTGKSKKPPAADPLLERALSELRRTAETLSSARSPEAAALRSGLQELLEDF